MLLPVVMLSDLCIRASSQFVAFLSIYHSQPLSGRKVIYALFLNNVKWLISVCSNIFTAIANVLLVEHSKLQKQIREFTWEEGYTVFKDFKQKAQHDEVHQIPLFFFSILSLNPVCFIQWVVVVLYRLASSHGITQIFGDGWPSSVLYLPLASFPKTKSTYLTI